MTVRNHTFPAPTRAYLNSQFVYVPEAGRLRWAVSRSGVKIGSSAGGMRHKADSFHVRLGAYHYPVEILVWAMVHHEWPSLVPLHRNLDRSDNTAENLYLPAGATVTPIPALDTTTTEGATA